MPGPNLVAEILQKTDDGHNLYQSPHEIEQHGRNGDGQWLKFLENAINGLLNERGKALLEVFHRQVLAGDFRYSISKFVEKFCPELKRSQP